MSSVVSNSYSKKELKALAERKRRNDFVRRREFDYLRKLRRHEEVSLSVPDGVGRTSFMQSSFATSIGDRESTLRKIDEIEAQMSTQWWKDNPGATKSSTNLNRNTLHRNGPISQKFDIPPSGEQAYAPTEPGFFEEDAEPVLTSSSAGLYESHAPASASGFFGPTTNDFTYTPELEEIAILYANGDTDRTEARLLEVLQQAVTLSEQELIWLVLFDLYRITGQQECFEQVAFDFATRLQRSAPAWFDLSSERQSSSLIKKGREFKWKAPAKLEIQSLAVLKAGTSKAAPPWHISWEGLQGLEPDVAELLRQQLVAWSQEPVELIFTGIEQLERVVRKNINPASTSEAWAMPANATLQVSDSGDATVPEVWWLLLIELQRFKANAEEFDVVALDYCLVYEVSPPSWSEIKCKCTCISGTEGATHQADPVRAPTLKKTAVTDFLQTAPPSSLNYPVLTQVVGGVTPSLEIEGVIEGDALETLARLDHAIQSSTALIIVCDRLERVDFEAAGSFLNWVSMQQNAGKFVQFKNLNRLVAVFFHVMGVHEYARVLSRND